MYSRLAALAVAAGLIAGSSTLALAQYQPGYGPTYPQTSGPPGYLQELPANQQYNSGFGAQAYGTAVQPGYGQTSAPGWDSRAYPAYGSSQPPAYGGGVAGYGSTLPSYSGSTPNQGYGYGSYAR